MKVIIAPTDFSEISINAVNYAADLAVTIHAGLALLHVYQVPVNYSEVPLPATILSDTENAIAKIEKLKEKLTERTRAEIKIYTEVQIGSVITVLRDYCKDLKPYAVVMGAQGAGAVERFLFGSNTISAMKHLSWPLIVVPAEAKYTRIKKIGLACDMKNVTETTPIEEIKALAKEFGARVEVIHISTEDDNKYGPEIVNESGLLQELLYDTHPTYHFPGNVNIEEGLSSFAEKNKLDLLIIVPKKHNIIDKLFHKSHSKQLIFHTHVPVMAVHE